MHYLPPSRRPTGPEDPGPKPRIHLTRAQLDALAEAVEGHRFGASLVDEGEAWLRVELVDQEGELVGRRHLPPTRPNAPEMRQ